MYDLNGNLKQTIDRRDICIKMSYNKSDMLIEKTTTDSVRGDTEITTIYTQFGPGKILQKENSSDIVENNLFYAHITGILDK